MSVPELTELEREPAEGRRLAEAGAGGSMAGRRLIDVPGAVVGLALSLPLAGLIATLVRLDSKGPVLYRQRRIGLDGVAFELWKFRTMHVDADDLIGRHLQRDPDATSSWNEYQKLSDDPRITRVGRILRRWSLDELPQLVNVLRGEMSLVGPRPILPDQRSLYGPSLETYTRTRPGLTGLWQVSGRNRLSFEERVELDRVYLARRSVWLDVMILLRTIRAVIRGDGAY